MFPVSTDREDRIQLSGIFMPFPLLGVTLNLYNIHAELAISCYAPFSEVSQSCDNALLRTILCQIQRSFIHN